MNPNEHMRTTGEIEDLLEVDADLTTWEIDFLEDIEDAHRFTDKQADRVHKIWDRLCG